MLVTVEEEVVLKLDVVEVVVDQVELVELRVLLMVSVVTV